MSGELFVDVSYRGLEVGRRLRLSQFGPTTAYLEHGAPLPVGASIAIRTDSGLHFPVRVVRVHEQVAGNEMRPGMCVAVDEASDVVRSWWADRVTTVDPVIPEPHPPPDVGDDSAHAAAESTDSTAQPGDPAAESLEVAAESSGSSPTQSEGAVPAAVEADVTERTPVPASEPEQPLPEASASEEPRSKSSGDGKKKRRRRRKRN